MQSELFNQVIEIQLQACEAMLIKKGAEYVPDEAKIDDRLHNFKKAAGIQECTPAQALSGMMAKHTISIYDMLLADDTTKYTTAQWREKVTDHMNYLLLLMAIVTENANEKADMTRTPREKEKVTIEESNRAYLETMRRKLSGEPLGTNPHPDGWDNYSEGDSKGGAE